MGRGINRLSAAKLNHLKMPGRYADGGGLWLQISRWRTKSWIFRYRLNKQRERFMGLGSLQTMSLAQARERAQKARLLLADGTDPIEERERRRAEAAAAAAMRITFKEVADAHIAFAGESWRNDKHRAQWTSTLSRYAYPILGNLTVGSIGTQHVLQVLEPIWKKKPETASRVQQRIAAVIDYAIARHMRADDNPARWKGHLDKILPRRSQVARVEHHAAMPFKDIPEFIEKLEENDSLSARALHFTVLCATRTNETIYASWPEFDLAERIWTIPAVRMKSRKEHRVPLSDRAISILKQQLKRRATGDNGYVFRPKGVRDHLSNMAMLELLRGMHGHGTYTVHGFRSSFRDWAGETTAFPREVIEHALAHQLKDKAEASYARGTLFDKRRKLMAAWASYCELSLRKNSQRPHKTTGQSGLTKDA